MTVPLLATGGITLKWDVCETLAATDLIHGATHSVRLWLGRGGGSGIHPLIQQLPPHLPA